LCFKGAFSELLMAKDVAHGWTTKKGG
jgi:hypothetical protein